MRICGEPLQLLTGEPEVGFSKRPLEAALKAVAVETPRAAEIVRHEAPSARRRMIARASAIFRGRPSRFPFVLAIRRPARTRSAIKLRSSSATAPGTVKTIFPVGVDVSTCSEREMNSMPRDRNSSRARYRWDTDLANLSNFHTTRASKRLRRASALRRFSSGREFLAPEIPPSTYSPANSKPRCLQYSRSSRNCISGFWPLFAVDTRAYSATLIVEREV
jgi:hypothetical protein